MFWVFCFELSSFDSFLSLRSSFELWFEYENLIKCLAMIPLILLFRHYFESTLEHSTLWKTTKACTKSGSFTCIEHVYDIVKQPMHGIQNFTFNAEMWVKQFSGYDHDDSSIEIQHWWRCGLGFSMCCCFILQDVIIFIKGIGNVLLNLVLIELNLSSDRVEDLWECIWWYTWGIGERYLWILQLAKALSICWKKRLEILNILNSATCDKSDFM